MFDLNVTTFNINRLSDFVLFKDLRIKISLQGWLHITIKISFMWLEIHDLYELTT